MRVYVPFSLSGGYEMYTPPTIAYTSLEEAKKEFCDIEWERTEDDGQVEYRPKDENVRWACCILELQLADKYENEECPSIS